MMVNNALAQARNYIISGVAVNSSSITASVSIGLKKMSMQEDAEEWMEFAVDVLSFKYPFAGIVWEAAKDDAGGALEVTSSTILGVADKYSMNEAVAQANAISELLSITKTLGTLRKAIAKSDNPNYIVTISTTGRNDYIYYENIVSPNGQVLGSAGQYGKIPPTPAYYSGFKKNGGVLWISDVTGSKIGGGSDKYTY